MYAMAATRCAETSRRNEDESSAPEDKGEAAAIFSVHEGQVETLRRRDAQGARATRFSMRAETTRHKRKPLAAEQRKPPGPGLGVISREHRSTFPRSAVGRCSGRGPSLTRGSDNATPRYLARSRYHGETPNSSDCAARVPPRWPESPIDLESRRANQR